jgi:hypothetical protein
MLCLEMFTRQITIDTVNAEKVQNFHNIFEDFFYCALEKAIDLSDCLFLTSDSVDVKILADFLF